MDIRKFFTAGAKTQKPAVAPTRATPAVSVTSSSTSASTSKTSNDVVTLDDDDDVKPAPKAAAKRAPRRQLADSPPSSQSGSDSTSDASVDSSSSSESETSEEETKPPAKKQRVAAKPKSAPVVTPTKPAKAAKTSTTPAQFFGVSSSPAAPATGSSSESSKSAYFSSSTPAAPATTTTTTTPSKPAPKPTPATTTPVKPLSATPASSFASPFAPSASANAAAAAFTMPTTSTSSSSSTSTSAADASTPAKTDKRVKPAWLAAKDRQPPPMKGKKKLPRGANDCLSYGGGGPAGQKKKGTTRSNTSPLTFVITGVLESLERNECEDLVKRHGGKVTSAVSGRTDYLIFGEEGGNSKKEGAKKHGTTVIDEEGLFKIICERSGLPYPIDHDAPAAAAPASAPASAPAPAAAAAVSSSSSSSSASPSSNSNAATTTPTLSTAAPAKPTSPTNSLYKRRSPATTTAAPAPVVIGDTLLVDKYRPTKTTEIIGNNTNIENILDYIRNFKKNLQSKAFDRKDGPKRAVLLCGPPGTGKTTAATVCAKELGFDILEFNASDARSKNAVQMELGNALTNRSLQFYRNDHKTNGTVVVMDECDGMSSSDRGGMAELIKAIKTSQTPVICIANDASAKQIKALKGHCQVMTWRRATAAITARTLVNVAKKEGVTVSPAAMEKVIEGSKGDIRQCLNVIEMWRRDGGVKAIEYDDANSLVEGQSKDFDMGVFDVVPGLFKSPQPNWLNSRLDNYFADADLVPLFVQENYLQGKCSAPAAPHNDMVVYASAADDISAGDLVGRAIQKDQNYTLMPMHGYLSSVLPASKFYSGGFMGFPQFLGKLSTTNKRKNYISSLKSCLWNHDSVNTRDLSMSLLWMYRLRWNTMLSRGVPQDQLVNDMAAVDMGKDEWDAVNELGEGYPAAYSVLSSMDTKSKSALTRALNKSGSGRGITKTRGKAAVDKLNVEDDEGDSGDEEEEEPKEEALPKGKEIKGKAAAKSRAKPAAKKTTKK